MKSVDEIAVFLTESRKKLGIEQKDMYLRIGMKQQQYQRIEAGSDVKLSTLLRVLEGLNLELSIYPKGKSNLPSSGVCTVQGHSSSHQADGLQDDVDDLEFWFGVEEKP